MDVVARECDFVTGRSPEYGGAGDSSILTAYGVYQGMRASADHVWGSPSLRGRRVGIAGVGKVGRHLVEHMLDEGASVVVTDIDPRALERIQAAHPGVDVAADADGLIRSDLEVYAPCALGGVLNDATVPLLAAKIVCGAANNQLAHPGVEKQLDDRGILYAPDYVVNSGGVIQVADEILGFDMDRARRKAGQIFDTTHRIFTLAAEDGVPPSVAADRLAERRMAEVSRLRGLYLRR
jgi:valine dehydrogenase (NAD+)